MRLTNVAFDGDEQPEEFTFTMRRDELALLYRFVGHIAPKTVTDIAGSERWGEVLYDLASGASSALNTFFDAGVDDVIPKFNLFAAADSVMEGKQPQ